MERKRFLDIKLVSVVASAAFSLAALYYGMNHISNVDEQYQNTNLTKTEYNEIKKMNGGAIPAHIIDLLSLNNGDNVQPYVAQGNAIVTKVVSHGTNNLENINPTIEQIRVGIKNNDWQNVVNGFETIKQNMYALSLLESEEGKSLYEALNTKTVQTLFGQLSNIARKAYSSNDGLDNPEKRELIASFNKMNVALGGAEMKIPPELFNDNEKVAVKTPRYTNR